ncbi:hypothetical protein MMYC01_202620 [Madurella mycetomatis]|uniref:Uncharacterized protein n=1 Tax=Madurella mycetomatis TaxID=100816 RepID=A0A175VYY5_9PEZI|nr:hypothetical protein MMYC01_205798 [Madurella mycetomatis]KXX80545.1 hypothetical protein MMYC01_202620 [Madurella mycetomatis]
MHLSTGTFITVLLAAAAQDVAAAPQNPNQAADNGSVRVQTVPNTAATPIPPEVLAAQQASASAAAAAAAAANSAAAAESGLRQPPGLQAGETPASLRPLPGLGTGAAAPPPLVSVDSSAVAPPAATAVVETQPALGATGVQSAPATLRQPPGLNTEAPASLIAPPGLVSSAVSVTSDAAQVVGTFSPIAGVSSSAAEAVVSSALVAETSAAEVPAIGGFSTIVAGASATDGAVASDVAGGANAVIPDPATSADAVGGVVGSFTPIAATSAAGAVPTQGFVFTNSSVAAGAITSGVAQATGGPSTLVPIGGGTEVTSGSSGALVTPPGLNLNGTAAAGPNSLQPLPTSGAGVGVGTNINNSNSTGPSLRPLPGGPGTGSESLQPLPNGGQATAGDAGVGGGLVTDAADLAVLPTSSILTTLTTVSEGVTTTLITAVAAQTNAVAGGGVGVGTQTNGTNAADVAGQSGAGRVGVMESGGMMVALVLGALLVL